MPNHYNSILIIGGPPEDVDRFIDDLQNSAIDGRLCLCQMIDPIPHVLYTCAYYSPSKTLEQQIHSDGTPLTDEEKEEIRRFGYSSVGAYAVKWWGVAYGCYDSVIRRESPNRAVFRFWTPFLPIGDRIFLLMHAKYPSLIFGFYGKDECNPYRTKFLIGPGTPILSREEIDELWLEKEREEQEERERLFRRGF